MKQYESNLQEKIFTIDMTCKLFCSEEEKKWANDNCYPINVGYPFIGTTFVNIIYTINSKVTIPSGYTQITDDAFKSGEFYNDSQFDSALGGYDESRSLFAGDLKSIEIPDSITYIGEDSFKEFPDIIIKCTKNSYAYLYALANNIKTEII